MKIEFRTEPESSERIIEIALAYAPTALADEFIGQPQNGCAAIFGGGGGYRTNYFVFLGSLVELQQDWSEPFGSDRYGNTTYREHTFLLARYDLSCPKIKRMMKTISASETAQALMGKDHLTVFVPEIPSDCMVIDTRHGFYDYARSRHNCVWGELELELETPLKIGQQEQVTRPAIMYDYDGNICALVQKNITREYIGNGRWELIINNPDPDEGGEYRIEDYNPPLLCQNPNTDAVTVLEPQPAN